jgi:hypothetical protein
MRRIFTRVYPYYVSQCARVGILFMLFFLVSSWADLKDRGFGALSADQRLSHIGKEENVSNGLQVQGVG